MSHRAGLDRRTVVHAAAQLIDTASSGLDELSLSAVAEQLGVRPPSLYKHVAGLSALQRDLSLLGLTILGDNLTDAAVGRSADEAIRAVAYAYRTFAREHPGLYTAALRAPAPSDTELDAAAGRVVGVILRVLEGYGLRGDDALHAIRALRSLLHGFISLEAGGGFGLPLDLDESYRRMVTMFIEALHAGNGRR
ncbi:MAG TPA: WHG domain-containing protein [Chloroflexota bacterium]